METRPRVARPRLRIALTLPILAIAFASSCATEEHTAGGCSYYAAPTRAGGGEIPGGGAWGSASSWGDSPAEPGTVAGFWNVARPGDTLCLRSGTYRGSESMLTPPHGFGGAPGHPIRVRALQDGAVWFDGQHEHRTLVITGSHWRLSGFDVSDSEGPILAIDGREFPARDIEIRRVVAWRNPHETVANIMNIAVSFAADVLLEDVGCFGSARKCVQIFRSMHVTARRVWARWDGRWPNQGGNQFAISPMYRSFDSLAENVLATSGGDDRSGHTPSDYAPQIWLIGTDNVANADDVARWAPGRDRHDVRLRMLGSIAYAGPHQRFLSKGLLMTRAGMKGSVVQDVAVSVPASSDRVIALASCSKVGEFPCTWNPGDLPNSASRLTLIGGVPGKRTKWGLDGWHATEVRRIDHQQPVDIFTPGNGGASICYRIVDGHVTDQPLWPWPMNARILAATRRSQWGEADVTADVEAVFGPIPPQCRSGPERTALLRVPGEVARPGGGQVVQGLRKGHALWPPDSRGLVEPVRRIQADPGLAGFRVLARR